MNIKRLESKNNPRTIDLNKKNAKTEIAPYMQKLIQWINKSDLAQFIHGKYRSLKNRITSKRQENRSLKADPLPHVAKTVELKPPETYQTQTQTLIKSFKKCKTSNLKIHVLEKLEAIIDEFRTSYRQSADKLSDEKKTDYSQAYNYMLHKATEMEIGIEAKKAEEQEKADQLVAKIQEEAAAAANFDFLGPELSGKIKSHLENMVIWPEPVNKAIEKLKNRPARHEINDILDLLQIPRNSDLAKDLFNHNFL